VYKRQAFEGFDTESSEEFAQFSSVAWTGIL
jgi:hypothetical protein